MDSTSAPTERSIKVPFKGQLHVGRPNVLDTEAFLARVNKIVENRMFSNDGPLVRELEQAVRERLAVPHAVAVTNATLGLELVLEALEVTGEVIVPSFTFVASAHAIAHRGLTPVFCDILPERGLMDPAQVQRLVTPATGAILAVNVYGNICDIDALTEIARKHSLKLIFDSAHALGVNHQGRPVGAFGDAEVFSLHATKFINGFEGGLVTTCDDELNRKIRLLRNFGFVGYDAVECVGTNAKLSEIHAAMAVTNFDHIDEIVMTNRRNYNSYKRWLPQWLRLIDFPEVTESNYQYVVVVCPDGVREGLAQHLHDHDILARKYFYPGIHRMKAYAGKSQYSLPVTENLADRVLCLPTGQDVTDQVIQYVCHIIGNYR